MNPTPLGTPVTEMQARYNRDGYIWIKNLIPREDVLDMREQYEFPSNIQLYPSMRLC